MNTTTDRHSRSYHQRSINTGRYSAGAAEQVCAILQTAANADPTLADNGYFMDTFRQAQERADEMANDLDYRICAAMEDGFGPEDFES